MKKFKLFKMLAVLVVLITSVSQVCAWHIQFQSGANIYFDNKNSNWPNSVWQFGVGQTDQDVTLWTMTSIPNTKLSVVASSSWGNADFFFVFNPSSAWTAASGVTYNYIYGKVDYITTGYGAPVDQDYTFSASCNYLLVPSSGDKGTSFSATYKGWSYQDIGKFDQTVNVVVNGDDSPDSSPASISITSRNWAGWTSVSDPVSMTNITKGGSTITDTFDDAAYTAVTTIEVTDIDDDYNFVGWYTAATGGSLVSDENPYTYYPREDNIIYARFESKHIVTIYASAHGSATGSTTPSSGTAINNVGHYTTSDIEATPGNGCFFDQWTTTGGVSVGGTKSATTTVNTAGSDGTVTANFYTKWAIMGGHADSHTGDTDAFGDWVDSYNDLAYVSENTFVWTKTLAASTTLKFKVWDRQDNTYWGCNTTISGTANDYDFYNGGDNDKNCTLTTGTAGEYMFVWNDANHELSVIFPGDREKDILEKNTIVYFDITTGNATTEYWHNASFTARFWFKTISGKDIVSVDKPSDSMIEGWHYYATVPNNDYVGRIHMNRMDPNNLEGYPWNTASSANKAVDRDNKGQNCLVYHHDGWSPTLTWGTYCPPMSSATLTHDGTTKTYGGNGGSSTPYLVATSSSIKVSAESESALNDGNMTAYYQFKKAGSADGDESSTETHTYTASSSNGTTEAMTVVARNYYNSTYGTASAASNSIYYKACTPFEVTHTLDGVTTKSGETGSAATVYGAVYDATFEASAGYALPSTITVTSGGSALTVTTDYTWNSLTGALQIKADKITGAVVIKIDGVPQTLTFNGESTIYWNNENNWSPKCVPTIAHDVIIDVPVTVDITNARAKSVVIYNNGTTKTGQLTIDAGKELVIATTLKKNNGSELVATGAYDIIIGSSLSLGNGALVIGEYNDDFQNKATVTFCSKSHGSAGNTGSVNQYVGIPFTEGTVLGCFYNSWVYAIDYEANPIAWKRTEGDLNPFVGYSVIYNGDEGNTYWMDGTLVPTEDHTCSGLHYESGDGAANWNNENLLANSWTAPIKINAIPTSDFTKADATIYIFNSGSPDEYNKESKTGSGAAQYDTYTVGSAGASDVIPSMQSFSVFTTALGGSLKLDYSEVVYAPAIAGIVPSANKAPKRTAEEMDKIRIYVEGESGYRDMIYMLEDETQFTEGFDNGWDGRKLFGLDVAPQFYALSTDGNMAVAAVPDMDGTVLGFKAGNQDSQYTISFDYEGTNTLYLYDTQTKQETRVNEENTYTFTTTDEVAHNRFVLSKSAKVPTGVENTGSEGVKVVKFIENGELYILRDGKLYNATGALVK